MANKAQTDIKQADEDFEPFCQWKGDEDRKILEVHLQGFKKEQMRVRLSSNGILTIIGERPVDNAKSSRFTKEIKIGTDCDSNKIRAKLSGGILLITMPKRTSKATGEKIQAEENALSSGLRNTISRLKVNQRMFLTVVVMSAIFATIGVGSYVSWRYLKPAPTDEN